MHEQQEQRVAEAAQNRELEHRVLGWQRELECQRQAQEHRKQQILAMSRQLEESRAGSIRDTAVVDPSEIAPIIPQV